MMEDMIPFLSNWKVGFGLLGEQSVESIHANLTAWRDIMRACWIMYSCNAWWTHITYSAAPPTLLWNQCLKSEGNLFSCIYCLLTCFQKVLCKHADGHPHFSNCCVAFTTILMIDYKPRYLYLWTYSMLAFGITGADLFLQDSRVNQFSNHLATRLISDCRPSLLSARSTSYIILFDPSLLSYEMFSPLAEGKYPIVCG